MKATNKTSTLRANKICIRNITGFATMYASTKPFLFGPKRRVIEIGTNKEYTVIKSGHYAGHKEQPWFNEFVEEVVVQ